MAFKHSDLESPTTAPHLTTAVDGVVLSSDADAELLAKLGYKQELRRNFTTLEIFGIAFSIMGLLPSIASTLAFSVPAGPAGMVWSWLLASCGIFIVGLAMADLGSAMPTSGGLYWWTHHFASDRWKNYLCFLVGYSNSLGLIGGLCSIDYGFALMFCSVIVIATDGGWVPTSGVIYVVFMVCVLTHGVLASVLSRVMGRLQTVFVLMNVALIVATLIALPVGRGSAKNDGQFIFTEVRNLTAWPVGWTFVLAFLSPIWTIGGYDSCVHMAEEASNAAKAVPLGMISAIGISGVLGFVIMIVIAMCMSPDIESVLGSSFGQPMAQIYYDALGKNATLGFMSAMFVVQYFMGLSILVAASRQTWAFSRDGALPFSGFFRPISKTFGYIPFRAVWGCVFVAVVMGLLCLIAPAAAAALFSLCVAGQNVAMGIPIASRIIWGRAKFSPGPYYTGKLMSVPIAVAACVYIAFVVVLCMFPFPGPDPTPDTMNYTVVINSAVWGGCTVYYLVDARKWFKGPRTTIETIDAVEAPGSSDGVLQKEHQLAVSKK